MRFFLFIILVFFLFGCSKPIVIKPAGEVESIKMYGSNPERNFNVNLNKSSSLTLEWNSDTHGSYSNTSFVAYDSILIVSDLSGRITAFHILNGKEIGEIKYSGEIEQTAIINNTFLSFIVNNHKEIYSTFVVYDLKYGKENNTTQLKGKFNNELVLENEFVYAVSDFGVIYKLTGWGSIEWEKELKYEIHSNPASDNEFLYIATVDGKFIKMSLNNGKLIYKKSLGTSIQSGISLDNKNAYLGDDKGVIYSIEKKSGNINWEYDSKTKIVQTPGSDENNIYFGNLNGDFYSLDKNSGKVNWIRETNGLINASPLIFENIIIQPNLLKSVEILDKNNGELLNILEFDSRCRTAPIYFQNRIFIGVDKGEVFCYSFNKE